MPQRSRLVSLLAVLFAVVGVIGYTMFGWRFGDGTSNPIAFGIALVAVGVAVVSTIRDRV